MPILKYIGPNIWFIYLGPFNLIRLISQIYS